MKITIQKSKDQWYFRILAGNGKVLAHSETYHNHKDCEHAALLIKANALLATIETAGKP